jgi:hypothetical protein
MSDTRGVDELFGGGPGEPQPRLRLGYGLLGSGLAVAVVGMLCTVVPGAGMVLASWSVAEKEMDRLESGYLPETRRDALLNLQRATRFGVVGVIALISLQFGLFCAGVYPRAYLMLLSLIESLGPAPAG